MFKIKIGNKFWNFKESKITSVQNDDILTESSIEANDISEFLKSVLPNKTVTVEIVNDNSI